MLYPSIDRISRREKEVLQCLAEGLTTDETARKLYVSHDTVKTHRRNLLYKLDAKNAFQLGLKSLALNLINITNLAS